MGIAIPPKKYLIRKVSGVVIVLSILGGFLFGAGLGSLIFRQRSENVIKITMVYSSEKETWIAHSQTLFYAYWESKRQQNPSLKPISLDFQPYGSGDSLVSLLNQEIKPVIWSPASNIWIPLLNAKWQQLTDTTELIAPNMTRIIYSPIILATWENFYNSHPFEGLINLHDLIVQNPNLIKMAHTDPRDSNSGFMATVMLVSSFLNMNPAEITMQNISNPAVITWMREVESSIIFYGKSTGFLGKYMLDQGPDSLQIAFLYENLILDYASKAQDRYGQKIKAIYPEEGTILSDHPFCILNADWVTSEQYQVAEEYLAFLNHPELIKSGILAGFRPYNKSVLENPEIFQVYNQTFREEFGVTSNPADIKELLPPTDGIVLSRIPDLWLLTRNE